MAEQFNPLDPLGIFGQVKKDVDRIAARESRFIGGCKRSRGRCQILSKCGEGNLWIPAVYPE